MRKAINFVFSIVILLAVAIPTMTSVNASSVNNKDDVYYYLTKELGFNAAAASGVMANIEHESGFVSDIVKRDSNGKLSGGLCMWNGGRFTALKNFCNKNSLNYLSIRGQMKYLKHELQQSYYKHIFDYLKSVPNNADGAYNAAHYWCYYFEIPANRAANAVKRGNKAISSYWSVYGKAKNPTAVKLSSQSAGKTVDMDSSVKFTWTSGGEGATNYTLYVVKVNDGKCDWSKAQKINFSAKTKSYTFSTKGKSKGEYKASVIASNSKTSVTSKRSNVITFKIECQKHTYTSSVKKQPTMSAVGTRLYKCTKCGYSYTKNIAKITNDTYKNQKVNLKISSASANKVTLSWSKLSGATQYEIYRLVSDKWKKIKTVSSDTAKYAVEKLSAGKTYSFRIRAVRKSGGKTYYTGYTTVKAATSPTATKIIDVERPCKGGAWLKWNKVSGASGYVIYAADTRNGTYKPIKTITSGSTTECTMKNLKSDKYYYFYIKAYRSASNKAYSQACASKYVLTY
ncbi:MAG: phage tail tip lysozyme [Faecalibacterium sp.]|nr:phage tail tip lysozyme [Ruminococcus sp.]MCM1392331.1 phage tail tip lysozyme [Ruminococcus sp.]MCM1486044.1 phage tail tip lysozyme [Faecalibacterium sp.]